MAGQENRRLCPCTSLDGRCGREQNQFTLSKFGSFTLAEPSQVPSAGQLLLTPPSLNMENRTTVLTIQSPRRCVKSQEGQTRDDRRGGRGKVPSPLLGLQQGPAGTEREMKTGKGHSNQPKMLDFPSTDHAGKK